eukprot:scaffold114828_cov27-Tisochrysis_lutea.AAC.1
MGASSSRASAPRGPAGAACESRELPPALCVQRASAPPSPPSTHRPRTEGAAVPALLCLQPWPTTSRSARPAAAARHPRCTAEEERGESEERRSRGRRAAAPLALQWTRRNAQRRTAPPRRSPACARRQAAPSPNEPTVDPAAAWRASPPRCPPTTLASPLLASP